MPSEEIRNELGRIVDPEKYNAPADGLGDMSPAKWADEIALADRHVERWHKQGKRAVDAFLGSDTTYASDYSGRSRLNLFYANVITLRSLMFAKLPKVEADRRFADPNDDIARVASEIMTRLIGNDMADPSDSLKTALKQALDDRLMPGMGSIRVRYTMEEGPDPAYADSGYEAEDIPQAKLSEGIEFCYTHWEDVRWSPCRTPSELRWKAFRSFMTKEEAIKRFGEERAGMLSYASRGPDLRDGTSHTVNLELMERNQAEVWEIWDKPSKTVSWYSKGARELLDVKDDPLHLLEFFPDEWMLANVTTKTLLPKPDYTMAQDIYEECDTLATRISLLTEAAKAVGIYDGSAKEIERMMVEGVENQLIPVQNWAMLSDKGGLNQMVQFFPIADVVGAIQVLQGQLEQRIQMLYQVTGMSDILRGQATQSGTTATEQRIKAQFGSSRIQAMQDDFAIFAQELLNKKVQIIQQFYDPQRIVELSNIMNTPDAQFAEQAVMLIKSDSFRVRVVVRAESMAQVDYDQLQQERTAYLQATAQFIGQSFPLIQAQPEAAPYMIQLLKFGLSGFKAGNEVEGIIDQFTAAVEKKIAQAAQQPPPPDPKVEADKAKMQLEQQKVHAQLQLDQQRAALDVQKMQVEMQMMREEHQLQMQKMQAEVDKARQLAQASAEKSLIDVEARRARAEADAMFHKANPDKDLRHNDAA